MNRLSVALLLAMAVPGCASPTHLQYDFGRSYMEAIRGQGDLTRPSVASAQYPLYGIEGVAIRLNVQTSATTGESGESKVNIGGR
jgi:hypothetical protein